MAMRKTSRQSHLDTGSSARPQVLYKRAVVTTKVQLYGTPSKQAAQAASEGQ